MFDGKAHYALVRLAAKTKAQSWKTSNNDMTDSQVMKRQRKPLLWFLTVNGQPAATYSDVTFAAPGFTLANGTNIFTAIAKDSQGRTDSNVSVSYLPSSVSFTYDANGNLLGDGNRCFAYDDENQLTSVWATNAWRSDFVYDGKMRRRIRFDPVGTEAIGLQIRKSVTCTTGNWSSRSATPTTCPW